MNNTETCQTLAHDLSLLLGEITCGQQAEVNALATLEITIYHALHRASARIYRQRAERLADSRQPTPLTMGMVIAQTSDLLDDLCRVYDLPAGTLDEHRYTITTAILSAMYLLHVIQDKTYTRLFEAVRQLRCLAVTGESYAQVSDRLARLDR